MRTNEEKEELRYILSEIIDLLHRLGGGTDECTELMCRVTDLLTNPKQ